MTPSDSHTDDQPKPLCHGEGCFQKDWCERWDPQAPRDQAFVESPIDKWTGICEFFIERGKTGKRDR